MQHTAITVVLVGVFLSAAGPALAQQPPQPVSPVPPQAVQVPAYQETQDAQQTRMRLQEFLRQLPPAVGEVLQRDPSLLNRPEYLAPYPTLLAFLQQHPEISRNPSFFLGRFEYYERDPRARAQDMFEGILAGFAGLAVLGALLSVFIWLVGVLIDHRRWLRLSKVQTDVHTKLLDRLTSNEDLLAYMQTPAGRRFLESAPITVNDEPRSPAAPIARILWSLQAGVVLAALGIGFWFVQGSVMPEVAEGFSVIGTLAIALGVGFALSAILAYLISARFGLVGARQS